MFRMLIHPSSGACDLFDELFHGLYCSGSNNTTHEITHQISRKLLRMDVLTSETCRAVNNEIIKQMASSWSLFVQVRLSPFLILLYMISLTLQKVTCLFRTLLVHLTGDPHNMWTFLINQTLILDYSHCLSL